MSRLFSNWRLSPSRTYALLDTNQPRASPDPFSLDPLSDDYLDLNSEKSNSPWFYRWQKLTSTSGLISLLILCISTILKSLRYLLPSYIISLYHRYSRHKPHQPPDRPLSKTAYLDGLRGVAALIVYIFHFSYLWFPFLRNGYGTSPTDNLLLQLPIIRILHSGRSSVTIFFVISGFVLTLRTLTAIHKGQGDKVLDGLAGSLFRRPFRLYLPILVSTGIAAVLIRWNNVYIPDLNGGDIPPHPATWQEQVQNWFEVTERMVSPFYGVTGRQNLWGNSYNGHLWTIPVEFKGSLEVFLLLLAFARSKRWVHVVGVVVAAYWQMVKGDFDQTLFCTGLLLSELSLVLPGSSGWLVQRVSGRVRHVVTMAVFLFSVHLMSYPERKGPSSPGFRTLSKIVPTFYQNNEDRIQQFWISVGAILFILALMYSPSVSGPWRRWLTSSVDVGRDESTTEIGDDEPLLQKLFTNGFAQYLGQISYSLYLWHGAVNHIVGLRLLHPALAMWKAAEAGAAGLVDGGFGNEATTVRASGWNEYMWKWAWTFVLNTFVLFWVSDLFHRGVDVYAVRLTRSLSTWTMASK